MQASDIECRLTNAPVNEILEDERLLATIAHGNTCRPTGVARHLESGLQPLGGTGVNEIWRGAGALEYGIDRDCYWTETGTLLFAAIWLDDAEGEAFTDRICQGYARLLAFAGARGYPHLVRVWNYIHDINRGEGDAERYKLFCRGRHRALAEAGYRAGDYPAASALGHHAGGHIIYLIAGRSPCRHYENPQQVSAYRYPREYGPQSPSFARATLQPGTHGGGIVYLSGTASIRGHETQYPGDLNGQVRVTLDNLDALTATIAADSRPSLQPGVLKVYIRRPADVGRVREIVESHYGPSPEVLYLHADICRRELLVEIEGVCGF